MKRTITITILAMALTLGGYAKTTTATTKFEDNHSRANNMEFAGEGAEPGSKPSEETKPAPLSAPAETDSEPAPVLVSPVCHGVCSVYSPWQLFLSFFYWG